MTIPLALQLISLSSAASAATVPVTADTTLTGGGSEFFWSTPIDANGAYTVARAPAANPGAVQAVQGVPPRDAPFDLDVGRAPGGATEVAWSRCRQEASPGLLPNRVPYHLIDEGCRLVELGETGEVPLGPTPPSGASDHLPSRWGDRVAFARTTAGARTASRVYIRDLASGSLRLIPRPRGASTDARPLTLQLRGRFLLATWFSFKGGFRTEARLTDLAPAIWHTTVLAHGVFGRSAGTQVSTAGIVAGRALVVTSGRTATGDPFLTQLRSTVLATNRTTRRTLSAQGLVTSAAATSDALALLGVGTTARSSGCAPSVPCALTTTPLR